MFAKVQNGVVTEYPINLGEIRLRHPEVSIPDSGGGLDLLGYTIVSPSIAPSFNNLTQKVVELFPEFLNDVYVQRWEIQALPENVAAKNLENHIVFETQKRLDNFARTRNYDGILSACTYATSPTQKFQVEGQYCVEARDATWAKLYEILGEVEAGTRPMPTGYADIEAELPVLTWPN